MTDSSEHKSKKTAENQNDQNKVIGLREWSQRKNQREEEKGLSNYLNILNFHELIHESRALIQEMRQKKSYCDQLATRSKLLINEFGERVGVESQELSDAITTMSKEIEERIKAMQGLPTFEKKSDHHRPESSEDDMA